MSHKGERLKRRVLRNSNTANPAGESLSSVASISQLKFFVRRCWAHSVSLHWHVSFVFQIGLCSSYAIRFGELLGLCWCVFTFNSFFLCTRSSEAKAEKSHACAIDSRTYHAQIHTVSFSNATGQLVNQLCYNNSRPTPALSPLVGYSWYLCLDYLEKLWALQSENSRSCAVLCCAVLCCAVLCCAYD